MAAQSAGASGSSKRCYKPSLGSAKTAGTPEGCTPHTGPRQSSAVKTLRLSALAAPGDMPPAF